MFDLLPVKSLRVGRLEGYSPMYFVAPHVTDIYSKQCRLTVNAQNLAVMGATLAGAEAMR